MKQPIKNTKAQKVKSGTNVKKNTKKTTKANEIKKPKNRKEVSTSAVVVKEEKNIKVKNGEKERISIRGILVLVVLVIITLGSFVFYDKIFGVNSIFYQSISTNEVVNAIFGKIPAIIKTIEIITISYFAYLLLKFVLGKLLKKNNREKTIVKLLTSFLKYTIAIVAVFMVLNAWGVDTYALFSVVLF